MFGGLHFLPATNTDAKAKSFKIVFKCCWNFRLRAGSARQGGPRVTSKASARPKVEVKTKIGVKERGWTLDVLNVVAAVCDRRKFSGAHRAPLQSWKEFTTADADAFTRELETLHPDNRHIKDKIRQQLQVLRDLGLLLHIVRLRLASPRQERGIWRLP